MKNICFIISTEVGFKAFLLNHIKRLRKGFYISAILDTKNLKLLHEFGIEVLPIKIVRSIKINEDLLTLYKLTRTFQTKKFDSIHSLSPKAGLLAMLAGYIVGSPIRIHTFTGQVWANKVGLKRFFLKCFDKLIAILSTHAIVDSPSQLDFLISEGVLDKNKAFVFGKGSVSGVDIAKFKPNKEVRKQLRSDLKMQEHELLFLFLGRLNPDKGVLDLVSAFTQSQLLNCKLLFVGPDESNMQAKIASLPKFDSTKISFIGYTDQPQDFMVAADVLCLPSYREGFGSVIIEAAACGTPAIASRIYGITDAIDENVTGLMHEAGNVADLQKKLEQIAKDETLRVRLGKLAYHRAITNFNSEIITQAWCDFYRDVIFKHD